MARGSPEQVVKKFTGIAGQRTMPRRVTYAARAGRSARYDGQGPQGGLRLAKTLGGEVTTVGRVC